MLTGVGSEIKNRHTPLPRAAMAHASSFVVRGSLTPPTPRGFRHDRTSRSPKSPETSSPPPTRRAAADIGSTRRAFTTTVAMTMLPFVFSPPSPSTLTRAEAAEEKERASSSPSPSSSSSSSCVDNPDVALAQARSLYGSGRLAEAEDLLMRATRASTSSCDVDTVAPLFKLLARNVVQFHPAPQLLRL